MQVYLELPITALEARDNPSSHTKHIYEDVIDDEDYDMALIYSDITDPVCTLTATLPEAILVPKILEAQAADSPCQNISRRLDAGQSLHPCRLVHVM